MKNAQFENDIAVVSDLFNKLKIVEDVKGIVSKTDLENRKIKLQDAMAKKISADNKFMSTKNELLNAEIDLNSIQQEYQEKLMKTESDKFSVLSMLYDGEGSLTKLQNQLANYNMRKGFYYVLAPQDGYISQTYVKGIGEIRNFSDHQGIAFFQNGEIGRIYIFFIRRIGRSFKQGFLFFHFLGLQ